MPRRGEADIPATFVERHRQIGTILAQAREREQRTITECATMVGTTRRRYALIERGEALLGAAELEVLVDFLNVPAHHIWPKFAPTKTPRRVVVQPGECVQLVMQGEG